MELTVHLMDVLAPYDPSRTDDGRTTRTVIITPDTSIADVGAMLNLVTYSIEYGRYYRVRDPNMREGTIPFVITDDRVRWNVLTEDALVADFLATFEITSNELYIRHGWPAAGGFGPADILTLWNDIYNFFSYISPLLQVGSTAGAGLRLLMNRLSQKASPGSVFSLVASRPRWAAADLAQTANDLPRMADLTPNDAKALLAMCRYDYDQQIQMYKETPESAERIAGLNSVRWTMVPGRLPRS